MEPSNHHNNDSTQASDEPQSGHWLPALRPDVLNQSYDAHGNGSSVEKLPMGFVEEETHIIPPASAPGRSDAAGVANGQSLDSHDSMPAHEQTVSESHANGVAGNEGLPWSPEPTHETVGGDELPSEDDEERLDPAWGINRFDSAQILDKVHRTTTFPEFSTTEPQRSNHDGSAGEAAPNTHGSGPVAEDEGLTPQPQSLDWLNDERNESREAEAWTVTEQELTVDEATQRFDEGVPLIQSEDPVSAAPNGTMKDATVNSMEPAQDDEENSFFSNLNGTTDQAREIPALDRKSTTQVLDSLNFSSKDTPDSPPVSTAPESTFFEELAKGGSAGKDERTEASQAPAAGNTDANWAALALDDDEFLVEDADDLLPDSEPGSPAAFASSLQQDSANLAEEKSNMPVPDARASRQTLPQRQDSGNPYAPHQPSTSDMFQLSPTGRTTHNNVGISRPELAPLGSFQAQLQQRPTAQTMKSFVDQAKDGYKSPYDLPVDLSKPRRRAHVPQPVQTSKTVAPPPRSSSLSENPLQSPFFPNVPPGPTPGNVQPPAPPPSLQNRSASAYAQPPRMEPPKSASSSFFEELPVPARPRPATGQGRYTPQQDITASPPQLLPRSPPSVPLSPPQAQRSPPRPSDPYAQYQLHAPERIDPYANVPLQSAPAAPVAPAASARRYSPSPATSSAPPKPAPPSRYSPAPPVAGTPANAANRYATQPTPPAPAQGAPAVPNRYVSQPPPHVPPPPVLPFQPRTSSPLAFHKASIDEGVNDVVAQTRSGGLLRQVSAAPILQSQLVRAPEAAAPVEALPNDPQPGGPGPERMPPPRRSQTQSPSKQRPQAAFPAYIHDIPNRPASAYGQPVQNRSYAPLEPVPPARPQVYARGPTTDLEFVRPADESQFDPLERWKGAPVFKFGFGGAIVSTFPKHVPRYAAGAAKPQIKAAPGEVSLRNTKDTISQDQNLKSFPGPLRTKSKKKELLSWMSDYISGLETQETGISSSHTLPDQSTRHHEKILLWQIVRAFVEHDGSLDGPALKAVNVILSPEVHAVDDSAATQYRADEQLTGIYRPSGTNARPDSVDAMAVEGLRKRLLSGDRQAAVFDAMDNRLWSHALIISSTMDRSVWSQVVREFVRQEVKTIGENTESLSALYEIFGGNLEESIDELVPPSARAGLQMVSKVDTSGPTKNSLDGLNRWKETLSLVLNNRCPGDHQALAVLGKLLEDYNRIEAAHICYLFSKSPAKPIIFGGADEEHAPIVLLGAHHRAHPVDFSRDSEGVMLTEIYEFATTVLAAGAPTAYMPHLSVYKLQRAKFLADAGQKSEALAYCDAIASTLKSNTKMSPYYHPLFVSELEEFTNRLKQTPMQGSSSWIPKPTLEKMSGSMWTKFSSFVVGEDSDAESKGSGKDAVETGPFANVTGTPSLSRAASQSDLYGPYTQNMPAALSGSRYAPNGIHSTRSSSELVRGRPSLDSQRSPPSTSYSQGNRQYEPTNMLHQGQSKQPANPYQPYGTASPPTSYPQSPPRSSYMPSNMSQSVSVQGSPARNEPYAPNPPVDNGVQPTYGYMPETTPFSASQEQPVGYGGYEPVAHERVQTPPQEHGRPDAGYEPYSQSYGYEPPSNSGYTPYVPEPDSPEEERKEAKPKKKSFIDDDDDDYFPRVSGPTSPADRKPAAADGDGNARKQANDAAADAAFRAAAEADAAREKEKAHAKRSSSSWFGGWLGGKKAAEGLDSGAAKGAEAKVYKANLGESKMKLYFDKDLGKWVNPDNPDAAKKTATPPPPRMGGTPAPPTSSGGPPKAPPPSHVSTPSLPSMTMGPPSGPASRTGTPAGSIGGPNVPSPLPGVSGPPSGAGTPPPGASSTPGLAPPPSGPSRPGTAASNASSIDDLIGPATGRKGPKGAKKGAKSGRYVDVMAK